MLSRDFEVPFVRKYMDYYPMLACLWKLAHSRNVSIIGFANLIQTSKSFKVPFNNKLLPWRFCGNIGNQKWCWHNYGIGIGTVLGLVMELQVLHGGKPVKCALILTDADQSSAKMKLLWCSLYRWSTFWEWQCMIFFGSFAVIKCFSDCWHHCKATVANRSFMWVFIDCSCMWVQVMLCVWSFLVLLFEAVVSGQLAEIFFSQI